ncbi:hypothetical protein ES288_D11G202400v1 [Gossypium darwinii]|uniref:Uncharacterized protein n=2 Tax=Gossypium TaxID=3633 RepID=A0A5D2IR78_GOSTO|nr:hypothetical protein ES288_D11G202400v1 [Gossypium darwinii]TYH44516.1 hypothetical protein ES332_D11G199800v1 [Gossypium tomentosum]
MQIWDLFGKTTLTEDVLCTPIFLCCKFDKMSILSLVVVFAASSHLYPLLIE